MNEVDTRMERATIPFSSEFKRKHLSFLKIKYSLSLSLSLSVEHPSKHNFPYLSKDLWKSSSILSLNKASWGQTTIYTTYSKLESGFKQLLQGTLYIEWITVKSTVDPGVNTVSVFKRRQQGLW